MGELTGSPLFPPHLFNSCYTLLGPGDAFGNAINFKPVAGKFKTVNTFVSRIDESAEIRRRAAHQAAGWYAAFTRDLFG